MSDAPLKTTVLIGGLILVIAVLKNLRALRKLGQGTDGDGSISNEAMTEKILALRSEKKAKFMQRNGPRNNRINRPYPIDKWRRGKTAPLWEEQIPNNQSSYLGYDGVPWGSCFEPHPYFRPDPQTTTISLPIINLGFPKAGTTSFQNFLECGGTYNISHQFCLYQPRVLNNKYQKRGDYCGRCLTQAATNATFAAGETNPLYRCGNYDAYTQIDMTPGNGECYWPQIDMLDTFHRASPNATFVVTMRPFDKWYTSLSNWHQYHFRVANCKLGAYPNGVLKDLTVRQMSQNLPMVRAALQEFYCNQVQRVREFVLRHPSHNLVEIQVGDHQIGGYLSELFGINETCWGIHNVNPSSETLAGLGNSTNMTVKVARLPPAKRVGRPKPKNETEVRQRRKNQARKNQARKNQARKNQARRRRQKRMKSREIVQDTAGR